jgi:hypothetical protein
MNPKNKIEKSCAYVSSYFPAANFAGEATPLKISDVKERLDRELIVNINLHASTILAKNERTGLSLLLNLF